MLQVAAKSPEAVKGLVLLNCAVGMNSKAAVDDWRILLLYPILALIDLLLKVWYIALLHPGIDDNDCSSWGYPNMLIFEFQSALARWAFDKCRTKENIRSILSKVSLSCENILIM